MENVFLIFYLLAIASLGLYKALRNSWNADLFNHYFADVAKMFSLRHIRGGLLAFPKMMGTIEGSKVRVDKVVWQKEKYLRILFRYDLGMKGYFRISRETSFTQMQKLVGLEDILTGDGPFDEKMLLRASQKFIIPALMSAGVRRRLLDLNRISASLELTNTDFEIRIPLKDIGDSAPLFASLRNMQAVIKDFHEEPNLKQRLLNNILESDVPRVSVRNIRTYIGHFSLSEDMIAALQYLLENGSPEVQVEASRHLGQEGMTHLLRLLREGFLSDEKILLGAVKILQENRFRRAVPVLKKIYSGAWGDGLRVGILGAFRDFADESLHGFLVGQLGKSVGDVRLAVIGALGTCGRGAEAVDKLLRCSRKSFSPTLRSAVDRAVVEIQSRMGSADRGWLSLEESAAMDGALSRAEAPQEQGALSLTGGEAPQKGGKIGRASCRERV